AGRLHSGEGFAGHAHGARGQGDHGGTAARQGTALPPGRRVGRQAVTKPMPDTSGGFQSFFGGLRVRLLLIIALVAVPLFVALLINAERRITAEEQRAREEALLLSRSASAAEGRMLEGTRQMLTVLA